MNTVTFIHTADLHLGAPFRGLRNIVPAWQDALLDAIPKAFRKIIDTAIADKVDFVVFAGDVFDNSHPSYADFSLFITGLTQLDAAGIHAYLVTGNHDPYISWENSFAVLPKNTHVLGINKPTFACYERNGEPLALIGGRGYYTQSWPTTEDISEGISRGAAIAQTGKSAPFMVGVLHTGLDIDPTRSPVNPRELLLRDVDYWACGHIHMPRLYPSAEDPRIGFAGCPQGRDMKEEGEHGIFKITLTQNAPNKAEFIPTARIAWKRLTLDISDCATISDVQERIVEAEFDCNAQLHCQRMMFRVTLTGHTALHEELTPEVLEDVRQVMNEGYPFFFVDALINETLPMTDYAVLRQEGLFPAVYMNALDTCRDHKDETILELEKQFYQRDLSLPNAVEQQFDALCDEAQTLVLGLLGQDEQ